MVVRKKQATAGGIGERRAVGERRASHNCSPVPGNRKLGTWPRCVSRLARQVLASRMRLAGDEQGGVKFSAVE